MRPHSRFSRELLAASLVTVHLMAPGQTRQLTNNHCDESDEFPTWRIFSEPAKGNGVPDANPPTIARPMASLGADELSKRCASEGWAGIKQEV
jgi:hypothetical protein